MKNANIKQLLSKSLFPSEKNRIWTMCKASLQMLLMTVAEAERVGMVNEQFYIEFEDAINALSVKDHDCLNKSMADPE